MQSMTRPGGLSLHRGGDCRSGPVSYIGADRSRDPRSATVFFVTPLVVLLAGCVSVRPSDTGEIGTYQQSLADQGPQERADIRGESTSNPLGVLQPVPDIFEEPLSRIETATDPNTGRRIARLTIEQAIVATLANSPEIRIVSFDPAIAKAEISKAAADFDPAVFSRLNYDEGDNPPNSIFQPGESRTTLAEAGVQQRTVTGAEWSFSYALTRSWDDLVGRTLSSRYEPLLAFEVRQPLWRDAWEQVNLAGVDIAQLNHAISLSGFRQKADEISTQVISAYWLLVQARRDLEIQRALLDQTLETLAKVEGRRGIDATAVQVKQAEASARLREAFLVQAQKRVLDAQDALLSLMMSPQTNLLTDIEIVPITEPYLEIEELNTEGLLALAMRNNPQVERARLATQIADINIDVAENQYMPRLDLVASAQGSGIGEDSPNAHRSLEHDGYVGYAVGIVLEYPLGNRQRAAELHRRRLERRKAISSLHAVSDRVAIQVKERVRKSQSNHTQIEVERQAAEAAQIQLQALQDTEEIREQLTPEFLLVKLQAQQDLAEARRAEIRAITEYNTAIAELAQATGTVFGLHRVRDALNAVIQADPALEPQDD